MNKKSVYILIALIVIAVGLWLLMNRQTPSSGQENIGAAGDAAGAISQDIDNVNIQSPDFQAIDADVDSL